MESSLTSFPSFSEENKPPNKSQGSMATLFGSSSTNPMMDTMGKELQVCSLVTSENFQDSAPFEIPAQLNKIASKTPSVDVVSFGDEEKITPNEFLTIKRDVAARPRGGLSILFGEHPTNLMVDEKVDSNLEELQEQDVWPYIESSALTTKPSPETSSPVCNESFGILQAPKGIDIPCPWKKTPNKIDVVELGDDDWIPPHVFLKMKRLAYTGLPWSFSMCEGNGRTLKGRDAIEFRDAVLRKTGFYEN